MMEACFSVIVLCYRRFDCLYTAIDSVLMQDYPNVELVVSDDGSPNFPREEIETYIAERRTKNIANVIVRQQAQNSGTVKHLNHAIQACNGVFVTALAGDDVLYDEHTVSKYAQGFANAPENCYVQMAQTAMYDEALETFESYYMTSAVQCAVEKTATDSSDLLRLLLTKGACLPSTSTCFKKEFFERFGGFDESYVLVEDYPTHVRLAEEGWIIHYENFVAIKHRHGGISHGQSHTLSRSATLYYQDDRRMVREIILGRIHLLPENERKAVIAKREKHLKWLDYIFAKSNGRIFPLVALAFKRPGYTWTLLLNASWRWAYAWHKKLGIACVALWALSPIVFGFVAQMIFDTLGIAAQATVAVLYACNAAATLVWLWSVIAWYLTQFTWAVKRFPDEVMRIGGH